MDSQLRKHWFAEAKIFWERASPNKGLTRRGFPRRELLGKGVRGNQLIEEPAQLKCNITHVVSLLHPAHWGTQKSPNPGKFPGSWLLGHICKVTGQHAKGTGVTCCREPAASPKCNKAWPFPSLLGSMSAPELWFHKMRTNFCDRTKGDGFKLREGWFRWD